jgi:hypothetical protein
LSRKGSVETMSAEQVIVAFDENFRPIAVVKPVDALNPRFTADEVERADKVLYVNILPVVTLYTFMVREGEWKE